MIVVVFFFKQKTAYEMRISDWSSDVCSSDLRRGEQAEAAAQHLHVDHHAFLHVDGDAIHLVVEADLLMAIDQRLRLPGADQADDEEIGRASCRERVCQYV